jgi:hypothetical protein
VRTAPVAATTATQKDDHGFGVVVPLVAMAILPTRALLRWIGWLGLLAIVRNLSARQPVQKLFDVGLEPLTIR